MCICIPIPLYTKIGLHTNMPVCKMEFQPVSKLYCQATTGTQVSGSSEVNMMQPVMGDCEDIEPPAIFSHISGHPSPVENLVGFMADVRHTPSRSRTHIPVVHRCWASVPLQSEASIAKPGRMGDWGKTRIPCNFENPNFFWWKLFQTHQINFNQETDCICTTFASYASDGELSDLPWTIHSTPLDRPQAHKIVNMFDPGKTHPPL